MTEYNSWAEQECRIACKRENPDFNFDDNESFDYGCSCYKSALKAYNSLLEDGHSGFSFSVTKDILIRLMNGQPLTPITDEDFFIVERGTEEFPAQSPAYLKKRGLKSSLQCPRMYSLFRNETLDGKVTYHDNDRSYFVDVESPSDKYHSWDRFIDDMFPITMPYYPKDGKYVIYAQTFLTDENNGDFDTQGILYVETPSGEKVDIGIYRTEKNGKMVDITKEEYDELLKKRIDTLDKKVADHLLWTLISNSSCDSDIEIREKKWSNADESYKDYCRTHLTELCGFFNNPENYRYNTFVIIQALCHGHDDKYSDVPELCKIADYLKVIRHDLGI